MARKPSPHSATDVPELKAELLARLPQLIEVLFAGRMVSRTVRDIRIGRQGSLSIRPTDGVYFNHETGEGGDLLSLIQHCFRTDFTGALAWARSFIGRSATYRPSAPVPPAPLDALALQRSERERRQQEKALALLKRARPMKHSLAERYLREWRGIALASLPEDLGFLEWCYNYSAGGFFPAMIAPVRDQEGAPIAAHCTFLDPATGKKLQGESVKPRLIFGGCRGGAVRLGEAKDALALCEGIEDGLSIMQCAPAWPVWVAAGTSGLRAVRLPLSVRDVLIAADGDEAGQRAAQDLATRLVSEGRQVRIATPPAGHKDFNAALLAEVRNGN